MWLTSRRYAKFQIPNLILTFFLGPEYGNFGLLILYTISYNCAGAFYIIAKLIIFLTGSLLFLVIFNFELENSLLKLNEMNDFL